MAYSATDLRWQIEFLYLQESPDGGGGKTKEWTSSSPEDRVRAKVEIRSSREQNTAGQTASSANWFVVIRYRSVQQNQRILYGDRILEIVGLKDVDERHAWLELTCEEKFGE